MNDETPIALLSFSTVPEQRSPATLQCALDALAPLPIHVVATTGGIVDPKELKAPANAHLVAFADHELVMDRASLVVGHGGHGTTMRALRRGLPMVGIPAKGADQIPITQLIDQWGAGRALPGDAGALQIRAAVEELLSSSDFRSEAQRRSLAFAGKDGAQLAASSVESLLPRGA